MQTYNYFVSYAFVTAAGVSGFGNIGLELRKPIRNMEDTNRVRDTIIGLQQPNVDIKTLVILWFQRFDE